MKGITKNLLAILCTAIMSLSCSSRLTAGSWTSLTNPPPFATPIDPGLGSCNNPLLLTDGSILVQNVGFSVVTGEIWKLTPDEFGSYVNGTWSQLASLPAGYTPYGYASAVLKNGKVIFIGGEFNSPDFMWSETNLGAIYDPVSDTWTPIIGPDFFTFDPYDLQFNIDIHGYPPSTDHPVGDAASAILNDGTFMLMGSKCRASALWDGETIPPVWKETGTATKYDLNDEEGWTLLPNGKVLTVLNNVDAVVGVPGYIPKFTGAQVYNPKSGKWSFTPSTVVQLSPCCDVENTPAGEIGPSVLRPDGTVFVVGANNGFTSIYNTKKNKWKPGPRLPVDPVLGELCNIDGIGSVLPNGNVFFNAGPYQPPFGSGNLFFEFDGEAYMQQPPAPNPISSELPTFFYTSVVLPTGQIFVVDATTENGYIYTASDSRYKKEWAPKICCYPEKIRQGKTYKISGIRFNGMTQATQCGDDAQAATNYPLVRITNKQTRHVKYCRTHDHSFMGVASEKCVHTFFDVPQDIEKGPSKIEVVANGIPSKAKDIYIK